jgi:hypothetical protein
LLDFFVAVCQMVMVDHASTKFIAVKDCELQNFTGLIYDFEAMFGLSKPKSDRLPNSATKKDLVETVLENLAR